MPLAERQSSQPAPKAVLLTDSLEKPSLDDRDYRAVQLSNELEALLVHDPETDKASAALDVNVGNFSDEDGMPGMAHAVEHLLFMGTKKFPVENEYSQYLSSNSGSSNAYTETTSTNYFFEVAAKPADDRDPTEENPSPLRGALDRFAQFFIEPLFLASTLDRELRAVDSENKKNLQNDTWRLHQLDKSLSNQRHPYCHFSTGNLEVLKIDPESQGIDVRQKFIEFHGKHYSANRMKLVVLGREPLDALQRWVEEFFSDVPNKALPQNRWADEVPYTSDDLGTRCFAKPVKNIRKLYLTFPFIDEECLHESQPSRYISHLLGHEGPGSILSYIKNKGWAYSIAVGPYPICPGTPDLFEISIQLTKKGLEQYPDIVKVVFQYVSLLRETSPQKWIFEELKGMADVDFKFKQKVLASKFTSEISSVMQKPIPRQWLLSDQSRLRTFEPEKINEALATIRPDNLRLCIVSRDYPGDWDRKEKWYGTEYKYEKLPADLMDDFEAALATANDQRIPELHMPHKNNFIPNELEVEKKDVANPALSPRLLRNDGLARTWWKQDDAFCVPRANVVVSLKSPVIYASAESVVKARLFTELVRDALEEYAYDADLASLHYSVNLSSRALLLNISGYNDKLPELLQQVSTTMRDLDIQSDRFDVIKERLSRAYSNWQLNPAYQQVGEYLHFWISDPDFLIEELASELPNISHEAVKLFQKQLLSQMYIETLVHGNLLKEDALKVTSLLESTFRPRILPRAHFPIVRSLILPASSNYVYNKTLVDPANINHCVETWLQVGDRKDRVLRAKTLLFDQLSHEPAFDQLRTKEQLGYIVFSGIKNFATTCGFRILIQSEKTSDYLDQRIEAFLTQIGKTIENMSEADFEGHKRSLIVKQLEKPENLDRESSRHWAHIADEYYDFEQAQLDATYIKSLTKTEIAEFYQEFFSPSSDKRARISVHLHARGAGELDTKVIEILSEAGLHSVPAEARQSIDLLERHLEYTLNLPKDVTGPIIAEAKEAGLKRIASNDHPGSISNGSTAVASAAEITHLRHFKSGLMVSQGARPVKDLSAFEEVDAKL